jgi:hypothetical protein
LRGVQNLSPSGIEISSDVIVVAGLIPFSSAVASTNGLKADPGWRCPWTARLNWLSR